MGNVSAPFQVFGLTQLKAHILSLSPSCYYVGDDAGPTTMLDYSGNGYHLTAVGSPEFRASALVPCDPLNKYFRLPVGANKFSIANPFAVPFNGDWTLTVIASMLDYSAQELNFFGVGGSGELETANFQIMAGPDTAGRCRVFWERAAGTDTTTLAGTFIWPESGEPALWSFVKDGAANLIRFYRNALNFQTVSYAGANEPTGGSVADMGIGNPPGANVTGEWVGGHVAFFLGTQLTDSQIAGIARQAGF